AVLEPNPKFRREPVSLAAEGYDANKHGRYGLQAIEGRTPPFLDKLEVHFITEAAARWGSFTKGNEIHYTSVPSEQMDRVLASKDPITINPEFSEQYHYHAGMEAGFVFSSFNFDFPEWGYHNDPKQVARNKALRCAVIKAFDWDERNDRFYSGIGKVFPGVIPPMVPEYDANLSRESVTYDLAAAKQLLADHGWTPDNLPEFTYGAGGAVVQRQFFEQFRDFMMKLGFPAEKIVFKQYATFGDLAKAWKQSQLPYISKGWGLDFPDAENTLQLFYGPNSSPGSNDANYRNPEYDRLYEQSSVMQPGPQRTAIYRRMNQLIIDDCAAVTGMSRTGISLWHKNVIAYPDHDIVGGHFLRYVDMK
ncbi:MAG: hypothetical protein HKM24_05455, partial [Gammaproteobacteria bacterium]|nr:hypothetical protein [Gammaproteobacteria bacterium]